MPLGCQGYRPLSPPRPPRLRSGRVVGVQPRAGPSREGVPAPDGFSFVHLVDPTLPNRRWYRGGAASVRARTREGVRASALHAASHGGTRAERRPLPQHQARATAYQPRVGTCPSARLEGTARCRQWGHGQVGHLTVRTLTSDHSPRRCRPGTSPLGRALPTTPGPTPDHPPTGVHIGSGGSSIAKWELVPSRHVA